MRPLEQSIRLGPLDPQAGLMMGGTAIAHVCAGEPERTLAWAEQSVSTAPGRVAGRRAKVIALQQLGRLQGAREAAVERLRIAPDGGARRILPRYPRRDPAEALRDALRAAGVPD